MAKRSVKSASNHRQFTQAVRKQGGYIEHGSRHDKLCSPNGGYVAAPRHRGDYAAGTRAKIIKALLNLGFVVLTVAFLRLGM